MDRDDYMRFSRAFQRWIGYADYSQEEKAFLMRVSADIDHSALLMRMVIDGKEPLPAPPPLSYSYPWYELVEKGEVRLHQIEVGLLRPGETALRICQYEWAVDAQLGDGGYIVRDPRSGVVAGLSPLPGGYWRLRITRK